MAEPGQGFYPYQAPIDGYGNGGFRFAGMSHRGSLLCLPTGMHAWEATSPSTITIGNLQPVFEAADQIDVLLVGLGNDIAGFDKATRQALRERSAGYAVAAAAPWTRTSVIAAAPAHAGRRRATRASDPSRITGSNARTGRR